MEEKADKFNLLDSFIQTILISGNGKDEIVDSLDIYSISKITRKIPTLTNIGELIIYLNQIIPGMIKQNKIYLYSPRFYKGTIYFLKTYINTTKTNEHDGYDQPDQISGLFLNKEDFVKFPNNLLFLSEDELLIWITERKEEKPKIQIHVKISLDFKQLINPYLYQDTDGKIYIIQNVVNGLKGRAMMNSYSWFVDRVNLGFKAPIFTGDIPSHVIYVISDGDNKIVAQNDKNLVGVNYLQILNYGGVFASMLPIL